MNTRAPHARGLARGVAAIVATAALLLTAACTAQEPATTGDANRDGELKLAVSAPPSSLDPSQLAEGQQSYVWASIYDTLLYVDNNNEVQPNAAESWEYSDDRKTLTLNLRDDLTFASGDSITADDVAATLERTRVTPGQQQSKLANVESISASGDHTVVVSLTQPDPSLLNYFAQATGVIADADTLEDESIALRPLESGPYVFADTTVDGSKYVLERRDDYWNAEAFPFKTVTVTVIQDQTAIFNALQAGEINAGIVQAQQREQAEAAGFGISEVEATAALLLVLADRNGEIAPALADVRVRQAINMAFDRQAFVDTLFSGVGRPTVQVFNPNGEAYDPKLDDTYEFDVDGAKDLLAEAGYPDGFSITMPSTVISGSFEPVVTQSLADIGITVNWEPVPPQNTASSVASRQYPAVLWFAGLNTAGREIGDMYTPTAFLNPFGWQTPEFDELLAAANAETDDAARADIYKEISAYTVDEALNAPIAYIGTLWATAPGIDYVPTVSVLPTVRTLVPVTE